MTTAQGFSPFPIRKCLVAVAALGLGLAGADLEAEDANAADSGPIQQVPPGPPPPPALAGRNFKAASAGGLSMLWVAPSTFTMGDVSNGPPHVVHITRGYWLGRTEVTQAQWQALMGNNPSKVHGARLPVERVSWNDAMDFCRRLTAREKAAGHVPPGYEFRLPTDAEWEHACRAGETGDYSDQGPLQDMGWYKPNAGGKSHEVAGKKANPWGFYDMHGNVWEWCYDYFHPYSAAEAIDPVALDPDPAVKRGDQRVNRGGAFLTLDVRFRFASRDKDLADARNYDMSFRPALAPELGRK